MEWTDVRAGLLGFLGDTVAGWLDSLTESNGGHQLAICLLIDLHYGRIDAGDVTAVISRVDLASGDPAAQFGKHLENWEVENNRLPYLSRLKNGGSHEPCSYARLLEISEFIRWYAAPKTGLTMTVVNRRRVHRTYFGKRKGIPLAKVKEPWHGGRKRTWVLPAHEVDDLLKEQRRDPTTLVDRLGLALKPGVGPSPYMVCVRYPDGEKLKAVQPTAFDANWTGGRSFFLSHPGLDGWGMSHGLSGRHKGCPELVHGPIQLTDAHLGHDIGECDPIEVREELVMTDAYARLEQTLKPDTGGHPTA
jgi:hypothetical protein